MARSTANAEWLDFVADLMAAPLLEVPDERIALQLRDTFELVGASYNVRAPDVGMWQHLWPRDELFGGHRSVIDTWGVEVAPTHHPVLRYYLATFQGVAMQAADVPDRFADWRVMGAWQEIGGVWGVPAQLALPMHMSAERSRCFVLGRPERFRPDEMRLAQRLQRLLAGVDRQVQALRRLRPAAQESAWECANSVRLTARELAVLALVAEGRTAAATGRRLLLAERTVRKHLERIYAKLGVGDRVSAVLRAQRLGLLDPPGNDRR